MAKNTVNILCPNGVRRKVQMTSNSNLLQVLEDICNEENLDLSEWGLIHQRNKCDLTIPWRMQNIPTNAILEMYKLDNRRTTDDINVQLQLPDNSRYSGWFEPTVTLQEMLDWYRIQPDSMVAALDISLSDNYNSCPICSYMGDEIIGEYALSNTTLRELGLNSGTAVIRYDLRPINDDELRKINSRIDNKIVRRRQQQHEQEQKSKQTQSQQQEQQITKPTSTRSSTSTSNYSTINSTVPSSDNEEYSIFRDPPSNISNSTTKRSQNQSRTLAEELGINISLDLESQRQQSQNDFRNFKFPSNTRGKNLYQTESDIEYQRIQNVRPCERRPIAYDLTKIRSTRTNRDQKSDDVSDKFYELTPEDLRSVIHDLQQEGSTEKPLETRDMREKAQSPHNMVYEQIAIRFVINSRYILQGLFRPDEPVSRLIEFAHTYLICSYIGQTDFYLYTSPPRVILSDLRKSLLAYDLSPSAYVYLGHQTISPLNVQLSSNVPIRTIDEANQIAAQYVFKRARPMNEHEHNILYNERPSSSTSLVERTRPRNQPVNNIDDKRLREKFSKFLPGKK